MKRKLIYKDEKTKFNPLKRIERRNLKGWELGNFIILCKDPTNRLRNLVCDEMNIKSLVFGKSSKTSNKKKYKNKDTKKK